jgi:hypothetical protein
MSKEKMRGLKPYETVKDWRTSGWDYGENWWAKWESRAEEKEKKGKVESLAETVEKEIRKLEEKIYAGEATEKEEERYWELSALQQQGFDEGGGEISHETH